MKVTITGGAGFIGGNLSRRLVASPAVSEVVVLDDLSTGSYANIDTVPVRFVEGSILDDAALDEAIAGSDAIVHLAALGSVPRSVVEPVQSHEVNATGTVKVLEAARRHGDLHTIIAGSSSVYGSNPTIPKHEQLPTRPMSPYAASKLAAEAYALAYGSVYGLPVLSFRFFNVFGPLQAAGHAYAAVVPMFVDAALRGLPLPIHGDGSQSRDFTYVGTLTSVIATALTERITAPEPVNLAFGTRVTLLDVVSELESILGTPLERQHHPVRVGDVPHSQADNSSLLSLVPGVAPIGIADGLRATVEWMRTVVRQ